MYLLTYAHTKNYYIPQYTRIMSLSSLLYQLLASPTHGTHGGICHVRPFVIVVVFLSFDERDMAKQIYKCQLYARQDHFGIGSAARGYILGHDGPSVKESEGNISFQLNSIFGNGPGGVDAVGYMT